MGERDDYYGPSGGHHQQGYGPPPPQQGYQGYPGSPPHGYVQQPQNVYGSPYQGGGPNYGPQQGYQQGYNSPNPNGMMYNQQPQQQYVQQKPKKSGGNQGCLGVCLATLCCCFVAEEGCECCAECCECCLEM